LFVAAFVLICIHVSLVLLSLLLLQPFSVSPMSMSYGLQDWRCVMLLYVKSISC